MHRQGAVVLVVLAALALPSGSRVAAQQPSGPRGWYDLGGVEDGGGELVQVELRLRLFNLEGATIEVASLAVGDSLQPSMNLATLSGFSIEARSSIDRSERLLLPRSEYDLWRRGAVPKLRLLSSEGRRTGERIALTRRPLGDGD